MLALWSVSASADSDPAHMAAQSERPQPWPDGAIPYDISKLSDAQQALVKRAMQRWMDTGARITFIPRTNQVEYIHFTGNTNTGNNTSHDGFRKGARTEVNITAFWWRQAEWMPAHELGHVLGFHHEHQRWDRDKFVTIHYEHIKPGRQHDYDWIPKTNWIVSSTAYDYRSIMHYRVCWASACESECKDGDGSSPCAVIDPAGTNYDRVIGQWDDNGISAMDSEKARLVYGTRTSSVEPNGNPLEHKKQKLDNGLLRKVEENPDLKRDYENLLKHVPEDQRDRAKVSIVRTLVLSQSRGERQKTVVGV